VGEVLRLICNLITFDLFQHTAASHSCCSSASGHSRELFIHLSAVNRMLCQPYHAALNQVSTAFY